MLLIWLQNTVVIKMNKRVELPLIEPLYSTYHYQGPGTAIIGNNQSVRNWYLNQVMNIICSKKFLKGYTTPEITIADSSWYVNPYLDKHWISSEFTNDYINSIIHQMINNGFYVAFGDVDDFYLKGKSWYKERHFSHDGLICGYDPNDKTYCIYAYDSNWIYQKFWVPQIDFYAGRIAMRENGTFSRFCGLKVKGDQIEFSPKIACQKIKEYLDSDIKKHPFDKEGNAYGLVVHEYIAEYVTKLYSGDIPYERMDKRVFRLIWEHKKVMFERIQSIERELMFGSDVSEKYRSLVTDADMMRMLYASHHIKRRDSVLPIIKKKLLNLADKEKELLTFLVDKAEKELENETLELSKK